MKTLVAEIYIPFGANPVFKHLSLSYRGKNLHYCWYDNHLSCFDHALQFATENKFTHVKFYDAGMKDYKVYKIKV